MGITPFGLALRDLHRGHQVHPFVIEREDGHKVELSLARHLQSSNFSPIDTLALNSCSGRALDVGAGAGRHSLELQRRGLDVYALEQDDCLIEVMKARGIQKIVHADIFEYYQVRFDTILMLDHGVGLAGTITGLHKLLKNLSELLLPGGQVLADSIDISRPADSAHELYFQEQKRRNRYPGEMALEMSYGPDHRLQFHWLHIAPDELGRICQEHGWSTEEIGRNGDDYLVRMSKRKGAN